MSEPRSPSANQPDESNRPVVATATTPDDDIRPYWERLTDVEPEESPAAFAAFQSYLNLPSGERSLNAAYRADQQRKGNESATKAPGVKAPGSWTMWSSAYKWVERARAYDDYLVYTERQIQEEERKRLVRERERQHQEKLEELRDQLHDLNGASLSASILLMDKCVNRLQKSTDEDWQNLPLKDVGNLLRAAATAAATASAAQAAALGVDELIGLLGDEKSRSADT